MKKFKALFALLLLGIPNVFAQIYSVGEADGFSVEGYAQISLYAVGSGGGFAFSGYSQPSLYAVGSGGGTAFGVTGAMDEEVPLPIELLAFAATCTEGAVEVTWSTASQKNNDFFTIERTEEGSAFEIVGYVDGAGDSNETLHYTFTDQKPLRGLSYYRLKQTDFDGQYEYFRLAAVSCEVSTEIVIFPNPGAGLLTIQGAEPNRNVRITDVQGRVVFSTKITEARTEVDLTHQPNGHYILQINTLHGAVVKKFILIK